MQFIRQQFMTKTSLDSAILEINKKFGENTIGKIGSMPTISTERVSSGSPYLDWTVGGGFSYHTLTLFY